MPKHTGPNPKWPTVNGNVACQTCHDVRRQCDPTLERPLINSIFLRQTFAPPAPEAATTAVATPTSAISPTSATAPTTVAADANPFCDNCHAPQQTPKFSPHLMLAGDRKTVIEQRCQVCHAKPMDREAVARTGNASLRADQVTLCKSCHPHHKDISPNGHVGAVIKPEMLIYMRARELTGLINAPSIDLIAQLKADNAKPTLMVPDAQGRIVCTTCHNPHQQGVFAEDCVLSDRELQLVSGHLMTSTRGPTFCRRCHSF